MRRGNLDSVMTSRAKRMHVSGFSYIISRDDPAAPLHEPLVRIFAYAPHVIPQLIRTGAAAAQCLGRFHQDTRR